MNWGMIEGKRGYEVIFSTKDIALVIEWDDDKKVGGVFKREYVDVEQRRFVLTKLANVFDRASAEQLEAVIKHIICKAVEQNGIRNNY